MGKREVTVALQGFGPFGVFRENPSERLVKDLLRDPPWIGLKLVGKVLPVSQPGAQEIGALFQEWDPDVWVGIGLASGRSRVSVERFAVNLADYSVGDEDGVVLSDAPIVTDGPLAYRSTLPDREIAAAWMAQDIPGQLSYSAGTFLCNQAFYLARHAATASVRPTQVGFLHVPATVGMGRRSDPALPYAVVRDAVILAVEQAVNAMDGPAAEHPQTEPTIGTGR